MTRHPERGAALLMTLVLLVTMMLIAIPLMNTLIRQNTTLAVKTKHRKLAYQLASAGIERGLWKLKETYGNWEYRLSTGPIAGYDNDVQYSDLSSGDGVYRIRVSSTSDDDEFIILSTAKDKAANEFSAIEVRVRRTQISGPLHAYNINPASATASVRVHWGPIYDNANMTLSHSVLNQLYPRKFAAGTITVSSGAYALRDADPSSPNTDGIEYWAFHQVPPQVVPDFDFYRASAAAGGTYYSGNQTFSSVVDGSPKVRFVEGNATFSGANKFLWGVTVVRGNCTMTGANTAGPGNYSVTPPDQVWNEYAKNAPIRFDRTGVNAFGDTAAANEYPGDAGFNTAGSWTFGTAMVGVGAQRVSYRGVLYCGKNFTGAAGLANANVIHGALILSQSTTINGHVEIFYDPGWKLVTSTIGIFTDQWREVLPEKF